MQAALSNRSRIYWRSLLFERLGILQFLGLIYHMCITDNLSLIFYASSWTFSVSPEYFVVAVVGVFEVDDVRGAELVLGLAGVDVQLVVVQLLDILKSQITPVELNILQELVVSVRHLLVSSRFSIFNLRAVILDSLLFC